MFRDLSYQPGFSEHNYCDALGRFEHVSELYFECRLNDYFSKGIRVEPYAFDAMRLTLSDECWQAFLRLNPSLPMRRRDYILSKLLQFLLLSVNAGFGPSGHFRAQYKIAALINGLSDSRLSDLPDIFHPEVFLSYLKDYSCERDFNRLLHDLNWSMFLEEQEDNTESHRVGDGDSIEARREKRQALWLEYSEVRLRATKKSVYSACKVDKADFYRYFSGKLSDDSSMSRRLDGYMRQAILSRRSIN